jgi:hypothetical protein
MNKKAVPMTIMVDSIEEQYQQKWKMMHVFVMVPTLQLLILVTCRSERRSNVGLSGICRLAESAAKELHQLINSEKGSTSAGRVGMLD